MRASRPAFVAALPNGGQAGSVASQAISLPTGEGSIEGMGESFSPSLSAGTGTYSIPIALPPGRNGVQPSLALAYATSGGNGPVGFGWNVGVPFIARQTDRGAPRYLERDTWHAEEDRYIYNGGQELVPVDTTRVAAVDASGRGYATSVVPSDVSGWQQYRARIEGGFLRFFRQPDGRRWVVQGPDGTRFDFGLLPAGEGPSDLVEEGSLERDPTGGTARIFAWFLTRMSDVHGSTVYYQYRNDGGLPHIDNIYYLSPTSCAQATAAATRACSAALSSYGVRVSFDYEGRPDVFSDYTPSFRVTQSLRMTRITVTAAEEQEGMRYLVRRYHLAYGPNTYHSLLASVQLEGRQSTMLSFGAQGIVRMAENALYGGVIGDLLPPMTFEYAAMPTDGNAIPGFGSVSSAARSVVGSPSVSLDNPRADLVDVNTDGLPDLVVTDPARYRTRSGAPGSGVFWNGFTGPTATPADTGGSFSEASVVPLDPSMSDVFSFSNNVIVPMDVDGDGRLDVLHIPRLGQYGYFSPTRSNATHASSPTQQGWQWTYAKVVLPTIGNDPVIDLVRDAAHYRVLDVNHDRLIDVVRTTGTEMQTWMNLGYLPGGDGRFGQATWDGTRWNLASDPIASCLPFDGQAVDFAASDIRFADMNGDGMEDLVRIGKGRVVYWPSRGTSVWGEGSLDCPSGIRAGREIGMATPPQEINSELSSVYLADANADGAADVIQIRYNAVDVWFNKSGEAFTSRVTVSAPFNPAYSSRVRLSDIDGSGTLDVVYGAAGDWKYLDLAGGHRPRVLTAVHNGLGATTSFEYGTSTEDYLRDLRAFDTNGGAGSETFSWDGVRGDACDQKMQAMANQCVYRSGGSPVVSAVVRAMSTTSGMASAGREEPVMRTEYAYHDGYYEGIEQEFRGFGAAEAKQIGGASTPTQISRTWFLQGRRPDAIASDRLAQNAYEATKGSVVRTETFDEHGVFLSGAHTTLTVRRLIVGLDGRLVSTAFPTQTDQFRYDTSPFAAAASTVSLPGVRLEEVASTGEIPMAVASERADEFALRGSRFAWIRSTSDLVDNVGHTITSTAHGRLHDEDDGGGATIAGYDEAITSHAEPVLVADAADGWLFRTQKTWVTGHGAFTSLGETTTSFDAFGHPILTRTEARIPSAYSFAGGSQSLTQADQTMVSSSSFDTWGSVTARCAGADLASDGAAACLRYGETTYDSVYSQLPISDAVAIASSGGAECAKSSPLCMMTTEGTWDRGLGKVLTAKDPNAQTTTVGYDGLGRLAYVLPPSTTGCTDPPTRIAYTLNVEGTSLHLVETFTEDRDASNGCAKTNVMHTRTFVDAFARPQARVTYVSEGQWEQQGIAVTDERGAVVRTYNGAFLPGGESTPPDARLSVSLPHSPSAMAQHDAFGRTTRVTERDGSVSQSVYHALSNEAWDSLDLGSAGGAGASARPQMRGTPTIVRQDGQGRTIEQVEMLRRPGDATTEYLHLVTKYRADGSVVRVVRGRTSSKSRWDGSAAMADRFVERTFTYDSVGRRIGTTDPDTDARNNADSSSNTWRYLYNRVGDLAAVRDPRGCGQDFFYDRAGRLLGEAYIACGEAQAPDEVSQETVPGGSIGLDALVSDHAVDTRTYYDARPVWASALSGAPASSLDRGRRVASADRGQRSLAAYDARGQVVWTGRQLTVIPTSGAIANRIANPPALVTADTATPTPRVYDASATYAMRYTYDHVGRERSRTYPADPDWRAAGGTGAAPAIRGDLAYDARGLPYSTGVTIGTQRTVIHARMAYGPNRLPTDTQLGDVAAFTATWGAAYDDRLRVTRATVVNGKASAPTPAVSLAEERTLFDYHYGWDAASNLVEVRDVAETVERPAGHLPVRQQIDHDSLYRVANVHFTYRQPSGAWGATDLGTDWRAERTRTNQDGLTDFDADPMRRLPAPSVATAATVTHRISDLTYSYDWLGNMTEWQDDAGAFYERSLGALTNGADVTASATPARPSALYVASDLPASGLSYSSTLVRGGYVTLDYGDSGNVERVTVHGECRDVRAGRVCTDPGAPSASGASTTDLAARRSWLESHCTCAKEQHYQYRWDEVNRMSEARRYDRAGSGAWTLAARQRYRYDAGNQRTVKESFTSTRPANTPAERYALVPFAGDYERVGARLARANAKYVFQIELGTESQYSVAGTRIVWKSGAAASGGEFDPKHRIVYTHANLLQTTTATQDLRSGKVLEETTFYPDGARETLRTTDSASVSSETAGFTGKEEEEEVGATYFGERYLLAHVGRWASPDPLAVNALGGGEAVNSFHYVGGNLLQARDAVGLEGKEVMIVPSEENARTQSSDDATTSRQASDFGHRWEAAEPGRSVVEVQPSATRGEEPTRASRTAQAVAAIRAATESLHGSEGHLIFNVGHGADSRTARRGVSFFEVAPGVSVSADAARLAHDPVALADVAQKAERGDWNARELMSRVATYRQVVAALSAARRQGVQEIYLLTCQVGSDSTFLQHVADDTGLTIHAHATKVVTGRVTSGPERGQAIMGLRGTPTSSWSTTTTPRDAGAATIEVRPRSATTLEPPPMREHRSGPHP